MHGGGLGVALSIGLGVGICGSDLSVDACVDACVDWAGFRSCFNWCEKVSLGTAHAELGVKGQTGLQEGAEVDGNCGPEECR